MKQSNNNSMLSPNALAMQRRNRAQQQASFLNSINLNHSKIYVYEVNSPLDSLNANSQCECVSIHPTI